MQAKSTQEFYRLESKAYSCSVLCGFVHVQTLNYFFVLAAFWVEKGFKNLCAGTARTHDPDKTTWLSQQIRHKIAQVWERNIIDSQLNLVKEGFPGKRQFSVAWVLMKVGTK